MRDPIVLEHVVVAGDRPFHSFRLTQQEADAMIALGFHFKVYDKREELFRLEPPYATNGDAAKGIWKFRQVLW